MNSLLSQFGKKGDTKTAETSYPIIADPKAMATATRTLEAMSTSKALEAVISTGKSDLKTLALKTFNDHNGAANDYTTSVVIATDREKVPHDVICTFTEGYQIFDEDTKNKVVGILGQPDFDEQFDEVFDISLISKEIPENVREKVLKGLIEVLVSNGVDPSKAAKAKAGFKPKAGFNQFRTKKLGAAKNEALEAILPIPGSVSEHKKTKATDFKFEAPKKAAPKKK